MKINKRLQKTKEEWVLLTQKYGRNKIVKAVAVLVLILALAYAAKSLLFAAFVNGRPISRISLIKALEAQGGQSVLDNLVDKELIYQQAKRQKINVTQAEIDEEIKSIEDLLKGQNLTLEQALEARGETRASLIEQIKLQKMVEGALSSKITITDEEVSKYFNDNKELFGEDPKLDDVSADIKDQLYQEKLSQEYSTWISDLRSNAKIIYLLEF
jgi:parvulin-like peptidyl-prolyl isomerase